MITQRCGPPCRAADRWPLPALDLILGATMDQITLDPIQTLSGRVRLPGSKSLANRVLLLAALAQGHTRIDNLPHNDDVNHMQNALRRLGIGLEKDGQAVVVRGCGGRIPATSATVFLGNSGTSMRSLTAALCLGRGAFTLEGTPRMHERPIGDLVEGLRQLGAHIEYLERKGYPPLRLAANGLPGGQARVSGEISSQFLSALLMAAPLAQTKVRIEVQGALVSTPYVQMTLEMMRRFGARVEHRAYREFSLPGGQSYRTPGSVFVEGDASSASYFLAGAAITGGVITVHGCGSDSVQGDARFAAVLERMGAKVDWQPQATTVSGRGLKGIDIDMNAMPDAAMTLAVVGLFAEGQTAIRNVYNWRVKESERMAAMVEGLRKLGADVEEGRDYLIVSPPRRWRPATIATYDDHRVAMAFSLAACGPVPVTINDPACTSKTFPDYFEVFQGLIQA